MFIAEKVFDERVVEGALGKELIMSKLEIGKIKSLSIEDDDGARKQSCKRIAQCQLLLLGSFQSVTRLGDF